jgi:hypothetical protein
MDALSDVKTLVHLELSVKIMQNVYAHIIIQFNSILYYECAESTAKRQLQKQHSEYMYVH